METANLRLACILLKAYQYGEHITMPSRAYLCIEKALPHGDVAAGLRD